MRPPRSLQLLVTVILSLVLFTTCLARPTHEFITGASRVSGSIRAEDKALETIQLGGRVSNFLKPRSVGFQEYLDIGSGWNMYYSSWPSIALPVQPAAWALTNLYASILVQARGKWTKSPPQYGFSLTYGGIRILMHCPQKPIPWLFVGNFAEKLLQITESGWTGVYQVLLSQAESDITIVVQLRVVA